MVSASKKVKPAKINNGMFVQPPALVLLTFELSLPETSSRVRTVAFVGTGEAKGETVGALVGPGVGTGVGDVAVA